MLAFCGSIQCCTKMGFVFLAPPGLELPMCLLHAHGALRWEPGHSTWGHLMVTPPSQRKNQNIPCFLNLPFNFDIEIYASEVSGINGKYCNG